MIEGILSQMGCNDPVLAVSQLLSEEDGEPYNVWRIRFSDRELVLKEAKGLELETYRAFFAAPCPYAPQLYAIATVGGKDYLLMEYIPGETMTRCTRESLKLALDGLIAMQRTHWNSGEAAGCHYEKALPGRQNRGKFLYDPVLEKCYSAFLKDFETLPRTLCHDDLLLFNVVCNGERAVFIDWEYGGILPYPASLARLIAHGEETEDAFFYMTEADKAFSLDYYYTNFIRGKGIDRATYDHTMSLFLFYEYCEWVYLGNKYEDADKKRYDHYLNKASQLAATILNA